MVNRTSVLFAAGLLFSGVLATLFLWQAFAPLFGQTYELALRTLAVLLALISACFGIELGVADLLMRGDSNR